MMMIPPSVTYSTEVMSGINNIAVATISNDWKLQNMNIAGAAIALGLRKNEVQIFNDKIVSSTKAYDSVTYYELMLNTAIEIIEKRGE